MARPGRRAIAVALLCVSLAIAGWQMSATQLSKAHPDPYLMRVPLKAGVANLSIPSTMAADTCAIDLVFPDNASPEDYGIAYHEVRKATQLVIGDQPQSTADAFASTSSQSADSLTDQLDARGGIELLDLHSTSSASAPIAVTCRLDDNLPWPDGLQLAVSRTSGQTKPSDAKLTAAAIQPYSFGFSALLAFVSLVLCWRPTPS